MGSKIPKWTTHPNGISTDDMIDIITKSDKIRQGLYDQLKGLKLPNGPTFSLGG
jgi:hypothetical protein